ncbi:MAG: NAD(P)/FAD-dependent oxidoreductase [Alphaproteobacteria bacterium]
MTAGSQFCVIGAGVFGMSTAVALAEAGHRVQVVDAGPIPNPAGSSWDSQRAVRSEYGDNAFYTHHCVDAIRGWEMLEATERLGVYTRTGVTLISDGDPGSDDFAAHCFETARDLDLPVRFVEDHGALPIRFRSKTPRVYVNDNGGWVNPGRYMAYLVHKADDLGVEIVPNARVVLEGRNRTGQVVHAGRTLDYDGIVLCGGAFAVPGAPTPISKVPQRKVYYRPFDGGAPAVLPSVWIYNIASTAGYGFPEAEGLWSLGFHTPSHLDEADLAERLAILSQVFGTDLTRDWFQQKHCNYSQTRSGDFIIDRHPAFDNVFVATGGSGHAFKFAPLLGNWIAARIEGTRMEGLEQFAWPRVSEQ